MSDKTKTALLTVGVADIVNNLRYWAKLQTGKQRRDRVNHLGDQAADALEALARDKAALEAEVATEREIANDLAGQVGDLDSHVATLEAAAVCPECGMSLLSDHAPDCRYWGTPGKASAVAPPSWQQTDVSYSPDLGEPVYFAETEEDLARILKGLSDG